MWRPLTSEDIAARLAQDELDAYQAAAGETESGESKMAGILAQVTALVRGRILSNPDNLAKLGAAGTVPESCIFAAVTIARESLLASLPLSEGATETRREELRQAHAFLADVSAGRVMIEAAAGDIPEATAAATTAAAYGGAPLLNF